MQREEAKPPRRDFLCICHICNIPLAFISTRTGNCSVANRLINNTHTFVVNLLERDYKGKKINYGCWFRIHIISLFCCICYVLLDTSLNKRLWEDTNTKTDAVKEVFAVSPFLRQHRQSNQMFCWQVVFNDAKMQ